MSATVKISNRFSQVDDYVNIIYNQDSQIIRRLQNRIAPSINFSDFWNGTNDFSTACPAGTYNIDVKLTRSAAFSAKIPPSGGLTEFEQPRDMDTDKYGNVYVIDRLLMTLQKFAPNGTLLMKIDYTTGTGNGELNDPRGLSVDTNLFIYISDQGATQGRVQKFSNNGVYISTYNAVFANDDMFTGIGYDPVNHEIYVGSYASGRVYRIDPDTMTLLNINDWSFDPWLDLTVHTNFDIYGVANNNIYSISRSDFINDNAWSLVAGTLAFACGISIISNYLYVAGRTANQIRQHQLDGTVLETYGTGTAGTSNNQFNAPFGITSDPVNDYIWVADSDNKRIQRFSDQTGTITYIDTIASDPHSLITPYDIALDKYGNVYIVDSDHYCVKKFDQFGNFLMQIGELGTGDGQFDEPWGVAVDNDGYVYVSDNTKNSIEKFDINGSFINNWSITQPKGLTFFTRNSTNYIAAVLNNGIDIFTTDGTVVQSFNSFTYDDVAVDYYGQILAIGNGYLDVFPANASGSVNPDYENLGSPSGVAVDPFGTIWITEQGNDVIEAYQPHIYSGGGAVTYNLLGQYSSQGSGDGQLNNPRHIAFKVMNLPGEWAHLWTSDFNRVQKFIINWEDEITKQVTLANPGYPFVSAAYPDESNTNVNKYDTTYYAREGSGTIFKIFFSQTMNTNIKPTIKFITADSAEYDIICASYSNNVWTGTNTIPDNHDGQAAISVSGAVSSAGSNLSPDPDTSFSFTIDTTPPALSIYQPSSPTTLTNIQVNGNTEIEIFIDIYNYTTSNGTTAFSSNKNIYSDFDGNFSCYLKLQTPKESTNWISGRAKDKAGNWSSWFVPRRKVICINSGGGTGSVSPSTNKRLGDAGDPNLKFMWTSDSDMNNASFIVEVPAGWASPSLTPGDTGYIYISDSLNVTFTSSPTNLQVSNRMVKVCFSSVAVGGYVELTYGTNNKTMVSNSASIGLNHFKFTSINSDASFKTNWDLPGTVYSPPGESQDINVIREPFKMKHSSSMPQTAYIAQSSVSVMTLFFTNENNVHNNKLEKLAFTTEGSNNNGIVPSTAISKVELYTNGYLFYEDSVIEASGDMITVDFSSAPLLIYASTIREISVKIDIANDATANHLKLNLKSPFDVIAKDENSGNSIEVIPYGGDSFPMRSSHCIIQSNQPVTKILTSYTGLGNKIADAGENNVNSMQLVLISTNSNVNEAHVISLKIKIEDINNNGIIPNNVIEKVTVQEAGGGTIYVQDNTIESSGDTVLLNLNNLYIQPVSSITLDIKLDIMPLTDITNFHIGMIDATNLIVRDKLTYATVSNYSYPGFSFPMRGDDIEIAKYFEILHDGNASVSIWEPVIIKACNTNGSVLTNYTGSITLDVSNSTGDISWTNNYSYSGTFLDGGVGIDTATYQFSFNDKGVVTLSIRDNSIETINVLAMTPNISGRSNNLNIHGEPLLTISKTIKSIKIDTINTEPVPGSTIEYLLYCSNSGYAAATNVIIYDSIPASMVYKTNGYTNSAGWSCEWSTNTTIIDNGYYSTDYTNIQPVTSMVNWIRWKKMSFGIGKAVEIYYKVIIE